MTPFIRVVGFGLLGAGLGSIVIAMTFCTTGRFPSIVWLRGSFQRPHHYTNTGWRLYRAGMAAFILGLLLTVFTAV